MVVGKTCRPPPPPPPPPPAGDDDEGGDGDEEEEDDSRGGSDNPLLKAIQGGVRLKAPTKRSEPAPVVDDRSDLLKSIQRGVQLKNVEKVPEKVAKPEAAAGNVAAILARRINIRQDSSGTGPCRGVFAYCRATLICFFARGGSGSCGGK